MRILIKNEIRHFLMGALLLGCCHILLLLGAHFWGYAILPVGNASVANKVICILWLMILVSSALGFGVKQMRAYKKGGQWIQLLHRPIAHGKIFMALAMAAAVLMVIVIWLPALLMLLYMSIFTTEVVDTRHYVFILTLAIETLSFYLAGCFMSLHASRLAWLIFWVPAVIFFLLLFVMKFSVLLIVLTVWLFFMSYRAFKPDLSTCSKHPLDMLTVSYPMATGIAMLFGFGFAIAYEITGSHNGIHPKFFAKKDSSYFVQQLSPKDFVHYVADQLSDQNLATRLKQQPDGPVYPFKEVSSLFEVGQRQSPIVDDSKPLLDTRHNTLWVFSHDAMLFKGLDATTRAHKGWLTSTGVTTAALADIPQEQRWAAVPSIFWQYPIFLLTPQQLYWLDFETNRLHLIESLQGDERYKSVDILAAGKTTGVYTERHVLVRTNRYVRLVTTPGMQTVGKVPTTEFAVPYPQNGNFRDTPLFIYPLDQGYLVAFLVNVPSGNSVIQAGNAQDSTLVAVHAEPNGINTTLLTQPLAKQFPIWLAHLESITDPSSLLSNAVLRWCLDTETVEQVSFLGEVKISIQIAMLIVFAASVYMLITYLLCRKYALNKTQTRTWIILSALLGMWGMLTFFCLNTLRKKTPIQTS